MFKKLQSSTLRETQACLIATGESSWRIDFSTGIRSSSAKGTEEWHIVWDGVCSRLGSMIQDLLDYGTSKELMNLPTGWIYKSVHNYDAKWSKIILDHSSPDSQRNEPSVFYTSIQFTSYPWKMFEIKYQTSSLCKFIPVSISWQVSIHQVSKSSLRFDWIEQFHS